MRSIFQVTTPASDTSILTLDELRASLNLSDKSKDDVLKRINPRVERAIYRACRLRGDGSHPTTLRLETIKESFRLTDVDLYQPEIQLSRRPIASIVSITENEQVLTAGEDYEILADLGRVRRLHDGTQGVQWYWGAFGIFNVVFTYQAGFATAPDDLKDAAEQLARDYYFRQTREPGLRSINIPGVMDRSWYSGSSDEDDVSRNILDKLSPFTEPGGM